jgi:hypothetical protein
VTDTSRRVPIPHHVRDHAEPARDAMVTIQAEVQVALHLAQEAAEADQADPWRVCAILTTRMGTILKLATFAQREIESIQGIDRPPDVAGMKLAEGSA